MKKILFAAMAATVLFASCAKDDSQGGNSDPGEKAKLTIKITNPTTRAAGQNDGNTDMGVANYVAIAVDANGMIVGSKASATNAAIEGLETTTAAKRLLVISNLNATLVTGTALKSTITTMAGLEAEIDAAGLNDLSTSGGAATLTSTASTVWSAGEAAITWSGTLNTAGDAYEETVPVTIRPVAAKVSLKVTVPAEYGATVGNFMMDGAANGILVLNAVSKTKFFGAKAFDTYADAAYPWLVPSAKTYYSGMAVNAFENGNDANTKKTFLKDDFSGSATGTSETFYNYYLFENDADKAADFSTIVTLKGTWGMDLDKIAAHFAQALLDDAGKADLIDEAIEALKKRDVYFPVHLTSLDAGSNMTTGEYGKGVQRGKCYNISLELTDKVFKDDYKFPELPIQNLPLVPPVVPPGEEDPTEEIANALVNVTVTVVNWVGVEIEKEW